MKIDILFDIVLLVFALLTAASAFGVYSVPAVVWVIFFKGLILVCVGGISIKLFFDAAKWSASWKG